MLFFGFAHLAEPSGTDLFGRSWLVLYHTLRIGGLAMATIALWLGTGHLPALLADAVVAILIGAVLILTGAGMLLDGGDALQTIVNVFCGGMFVSSGLRNRREFLEFRGHKGRAVRSLLQSHAAEHSESRPADQSTRENGPEQTEGKPPVSSSATRLRQLPAHEADPAPSSGSASVQVDTSSEGGETPEAASPRTPVSSSEPPPEGFLAAFAKKDPPPQQDGKQERGE